MGRKKIRGESPVERRARLVAELRLFGHVESARLLEADGKAGEFTVVYGTWSPNAKAHAKMQEFGSGEQAAEFAREFADMYIRHDIEDAGKRRVHGDPDAVGVWALRSDWMPMVGYEDKWNEEADPEHEDRHNEKDED